MWIRRSRGTWGEGWKRKKRRRKSEKEGECKVSLAPSPSLHPDEGNVASCTLDPPSKVRKLITCYNRSQHTSRERERERGMEARKTEGGEGEGTRRVKGEGKVEKRRRKGEEIRKGKKEWNEGNKVVRKEWEKVWWERVNRRKKKAIGGSGDGGRREMGRKKARMGNWEKLGEIRSSSIRFLSSDLQYDHHLVL